MSAAIRPRSADGPIGWRTRPGLTDRPDDRGWRVVHDPVSSVYHRIDPLRWLVLEALRGSASRDEVRERIEAAFRPRRISLAEIDRILASLRRERLIVLAGGRGSRQDPRHRDAHEPPADSRDNSRDNFGDDFGDDFGHGVSKAGGLGWLAITLPSIDPTPVVSRLQPILGRLFGLPAVAAAAVGLWISMLWWSGTAESAADRLATAWANVSLLGWAAVMIVIALTKTWHELGHASACHRFGVRCRGIGAMLLVGVPTLYCDATDAWTLPSRWRRSVTALAGVYFEIWLITALTAIVAGTRAGWIQDLALVTITGSLAGTILVNLNPLLRFDGYYVLSDWLGVPNLASRGRTFWASRLGRCIAADGASDDDLTRRQRLAVAVYGAAAGAFRLAVLGIIFAILAVTADWLNLRFVVPVIAATLVWAVIGPVLTGTVGLVRGRPVGRWAAGLRAAGLAALALGLLWTAAVWPIDHRVGQIGVLRPADAVTLYSPADAVLRRWHVQIGQKVAAGEPLIELVDDDLRLRAADVQSRLATATARWRAAIRSRGGPADLKPPSIPHLRSSVDRLTDQARRLGDLVDQCHIVAPIAGVVRSSRWTEQGGAEAGLTRVDPRHVDQAVAAGQPLIAIESSDRPRVLVPLDRTAAARVRRGAAARVTPRATPDQSWAAIVSSIAPASTDRLPPSLRTLVGESVAATAGGDRREIGQIDEGGLSSRPQWWITEIQLDPPAGSAHSTAGWLSGSHVAVQIDATPRSVWQLVRDAWRRHRR